MRAILPSSARPIAPGTFFQRRIAKTTTIANATQPPGLRPRTVGSDIELGLHRRGGFLGIHRYASQPADHFLGGFGSDRLDLGSRGIERFTDPGLGGFDLEVDLVR